MRRGKDADPRQPWRNVETVADVREYVKRHTSSGISDAWKEMLEDIDRFGSKYSMDDFHEEADIQAADGNT
jgi:hypothetical protein